MLLALEKQAPEKKDKAIYNLYGNPVNGFSRYVNFWFFVLCENNSTDKNISFIMQVGGAHNLKVDARETGNVLNV